jgi:ribosomal protein L44E
MGFEVFDVSWARTPGSERLSDSSRLSFQRKKPGAGLIGKIVQKRKADPTSKTTLTP